MKDGSKLERAIDFGKSQKFELNIDPSNTEEFMVHGLRLTQKESNDEGLFRDLPGFYEDEGLFNSYQTNNTKYKSQAE